MMYTETPGMFQLARVRSTLGILQDYGPAIFCPVELKTVTCPPLVMATKWFGRPTTESAGDGSGCVHTNALVSSTTVMAGVAAFLLNAPCVTPSVANMICPSGCTNVCHGGGAD